MLYLEILRRSQSELGVCAYQGATWIPGGVSGISGILGLATSATSNPRLSSKLLSFAAALFSPPQTCLQGHP